MFLICFPLLHFALTVWPPPSPLRVHVRSICLCFDGSPRSRSRKCFTHSLRTMFNVCLCAVPPPTTELTSPPINQFRTPSQWPTPTLLRSTPRPPSAKPTVSTCSAPRCPSPTRSSSTSAPRRPPSPRRASSPPPAASSSSARTSPSPAPPRPPSPAPSTGARCRRPSRARRSPSPLSSRRTRSASRASRRSSSSAWTRTCPPPPAAPRLRTSSSSISARIS